ncbi:ATP-binding protein [Streptomyces virginiae]|uniref:ATP-binding protein n=1 Tax=Streptomyces virginiae TaxID=1961 RepID=UPI003451E021
MNAVRHNRAGGRIEVSTSEDGELTVSNTGPVIDPADVPGLLEPFRRRAERQHTAGEVPGWACRSPRRSRGRTTRS